MTPVGQGFLRSLPCGHFEFRFTKRSFLISVTTFLLVNSRHFSSYCQGPTCPNMPTEAPHMQVIPTQIVEQGCFGTGGQGT